MGLGNGGELLTLNVFPGKYWTNLYVNLKVTSLTEFGEFMCIILRYNIIC
jgi:hypothetical protein